MSKISLKDFLKKFTSISNSFIDKYYKFYELCEKEPFGININSVFKYLELKNEKKFIERIRNNYKENNDYIIKKNNEKMTKNNIYFNYYINFETYEKIIMMSKTDIGKQARNYFITLRKFIDYYKEHIHDKIIELTNNNQFIYILGVNKHKNIFKIGRTKDIRQRLYNYSVGLENHPDILYIQIVNNSNDVENCIKLFTKNHKRNKKEQYNIDYDTLKEIIFNCANIDKIINNKRNNKNIDTYIIFDDSKNINYINISNEKLEIKEFNENYELNKNIIKKSSKKLSNINNITF